MNCDLDTSIPDWVIDHPESAAVFDELRIDTSCGGKSLRYLCQQKGLDPVTILERLLNVIDIKIRETNNDDQEERATTKQ